MASIGSVTKQIAALEISNKKPVLTSATSSSRLGHTKQSSQTSVTKLLTKYGAPNPFTNTINKPTQPSSLRNPTSCNQPQAPTGSQSTIDIGTYDGGLELENEKRGERVFGEAAEELALNSSTSRYASHFLMP